MNRRANVFEIDILWSIRKKTNKPPCDAHFKEASKLVSSTQSKDVLRQKVLERVQLKGVQLLRSIKYIIN